MWLRSPRKLCVRFPVMELEVHLEEGEEIRTEISTKFTRAGIERECATAGLRVEQWLLCARVAVAQRFDGQLRSIRALRVPPHPVYDDEQQRSIALYDRDAVLVFLAVT